MKIAQTATLITGAGRGLGRALAEELARRGARLGLVSRSPEQLEQVVRAIREQAGEAHALLADVSRKEDVYPLLGAATALLGPIKLLVHNASTLGPTPLRLLLDTECEDLARVLETNLLGPFRLSKAVAGAMALGDGGTLLHISSDASVEAYPSWGAYSVSKAALDHLARLWAAELGSHSVRSLSVDPGEMRTQMHAEAMPDADPSTLADPHEVARRIAAILESPSLPNGARVRAADFPLEAS
jgi:NAD(P)-dependent dehydrogenase (short-subunit alcohol dehydrogenase family)